MATITNAEVAAALAAIHTAHPKFFGACTGITGVTDDTTQASADFTFSTAAAYGPVVVTMNYLELSVSVTARQIMMGAVADSLAAAVGAGDYGPLTRVTAISALPHENLNTPRIEFTTKNSNPVHLTYHELASSAMRDARIQTREGINAAVVGLVAALAAIKVTTDTWSEPYSKANYTALTKALTAIPEIKGQL